MFVDKSKFGRECVKELNKVSSLLDTMDVKHVVIGDYALLMHGFKIKPQLVEVLCEDKREKIVPMLFKLGYTVYHISDELIKAAKGDVEIHFRLVKESRTSLDGVSITLPEDWYKVEEKEVWFPTIKTRGSYKAASLELLYCMYLLFSDKDHLEMILGRKVDFDRIMKFLKLNGMI